MNQKQTFDIDGVNVVEENIGDVAKITRVEVLDERGEKTIGKPIGNYVTIESEALKDGDADAHEEITGALSDILTSLIPQTSGIVLVVGLGNVHVTPDALGVRIIDKIFVTNHIMDELDEAQQGAVRRVAAIKPGVMGTTGMKTNAIIKGVCDQLKPSAVIVIDALAARKMNRVNSTIQLADTGVSAGSGLGGAGALINAELLGCPVIAIGVPTVVDTATIVNDALDAMLDDMIKESGVGGQFYTMLKNLQEQERYGLIKKILAQTGNQMFVTPKEVDTVIDRTANIIANAINMSLQPSLDIEDVRRFMY